MKRDDVRSDGSTGQPQGMGWTTLTWGLLVFVALLPIALLGLYSFRLAARSVRDLVRSSNLSAGRIAAELVSHDLEQSIDLARAVAALPGMIEAVERRDEEAVRAHLRPVVRSYPRVDRAFVTDPSGLLWSDFPRAPESLSRSFSQRDWYRGLARVWKPYVSEVYQRQAAPRALVVAIAAPIRSEAQPVLGALVYQYRLEGITQWLQRIRVGNSGYVFVIDHTGTVAAHPRLTFHGHERNEYARLAPVQQALRGRSETAEYRDPLVRRAMVATFIPVPVGDHWWVVVAQQPTDEAYAPIHQLGVHLGAGAGILALAALGVVGGLGQASERNRRLNRQLEQRRRQLQQLAAIVEFADEAILSETLDGAVVSWNPGAERMLGYSAPEAKGRPISFLIPPDRPDEMPQILARIERGELVGHHETVWARKEGRQIAVSMSVSPLRDAAGAVTGASIIARDITERRQVEEELRQSEARLRLAQEAAHIGTWDSDLLTGKLDWPASVEAMFGFAPGAFSGTREAFLERVHPDDRERVSREVARAIETGSDYNIEHRILWSNGSIRWMAARGRVFPDESGAPAHLIGIVMDITERKRAERRLAAQHAVTRVLAEAATLSEATPGILQAVCTSTDWEVGALWTLDPQAPGALRCVELWHTPPVPVPAFEAATRSSAFAPGIGLPGRVWQSEQPTWIVDVVQDANFPRAAAAAREDLHGAFAFPIRMESEILGVIEFFSREIRPPDPDLLEMFGAIGSQIGQFIERKRAEAELQRAKERAEAADRAKSEFLANMSHEIRTPMNGILGMTELALDTELTPEQREYLALVKSSADALLEVLNDILDFSKIEAGKLGLELIDFNLRDSLGDTLKTLGLRAAQQGLELTYHVPPAVPDVLVGDPVRLRQIVYNLVSNAIKFTEQGEVVVHVAPASQADDAITLHFAVADTGIGIPPEKQQRIFEAFAQADSSTTRQYGGSGLGLAIAQQLAQMMGGRIWVESAGAGTGSTFHFTARFGLGEAGRAGERPAPTLSLSPTPLLDLPVLVVDDNATNRRILEEILASWRMKPMAVDGGEAALDAMQQARAAGEPFALVLLDAMMPGMDGFALAAEIQRHPDLVGATLMMLSSAAQRGDADRCRKLGVAAYLTKPIKQSDLLDTIMQVRSAEFAAHRTGDGPRPDSAPRTPHPAHARPLRILLAEDIEVNQKLAARMLEKWGHSVVVVSNGLQALAALERQPFDLVLMDVQMPEMDGFDATAAIRAGEKESGRHVLIIAMTAHAMKGDRERCLEAGMDGYVSKPIQPKELFQAMADLIPGPSSRGGAGYPQNGQGGEAPGAAFDESDLLERVEGDVALLRELVALFLGSYRDRLSELRQAIARGDGPAVERLAHALKGSIGNFAAQPASAVALQLEEIGRSGDLSAAEAALDGLEAELERLETALLAWGSEASP